MKGTSLIKCIHIFPGNNQSTYECGDKHLPSRTTAQAGRRWMDEEETEDRAVKSVLSQVGVLCPGGQARVKPRPVPPPQGPGGRCRGTYEQCPSGSDA